MPTPRSPVRSRSAARFTRARGGVGIRAGLRYQCPIGYESSNLSGRTTASPTGKAIPAWRIILIMPRPRRWTDDQLRTAVAESSTWGEVVTRMGQADYGAARRNFQAHAVRLELPVGHLPTFRPIAPRAPSDRPSVDLGTLLAAVQESTTWAEVLRRLGARLPREHADRASAV